MLDLSEKLKAMPAGRKHALRYQAHVRSILEYLFCPPLEPPEYEVRGNDGADRRDIIFENRSNLGYWVDIRERYDGEFPVFDAKNLGVSLGKRDVLALAHYLKPYGCGMFGGLVIRGREGRQSSYARREQWISQNKMIIVLNDRDLLEMLDRKRSGQDPSFFIARQIAEFRMSL